ncbi:MAG: tetratricopeptide repeat protein [Smithella sp.]|nr:tetratricopeptide repeat protein [Smithella sp.]
MTNIHPGRQKLIIYTILIVATLAVYLQVCQFDFINLDDSAFVTKNIHIQSGISLEGMRWALGTTHVNDFWYPLTLLSLMLDHQLFGLNAGGYHLTNLVLHMLSVLLLFWLFHRMTGAVWKSAFVAAFFALHPLQVESVAWIAERKGLLSGFFWMLTLCLYVRYTEKPAIKRYLPVLFSFALALLSKPMIVTLPVVMILLDYWPLKRFDFEKGKFLLWQLKEKTPFFILSAVIVVTTFIIQYDPSKTAFSAASRLGNAPIIFMAHLGQIIWPQNLALGYPFFDHFNLWMSLGATALIIIISFAVISTARRWPFLVVGWLWYAVTIAPVLGIIYIGQFLMADRFTYLPSIGISIMLAWGVPLLFARKNSMQKILFPSAAVFLIVISALAWKQCSYWKDSYTLFHHALQVTDNNYLAHSCFGSALFDKGNVPEAIAHFDEAIRINPEFISAYNHRGIVYAKTGHRQKALENFNTAIRMKPRDANAYRNRATLYGEMGEYHSAIEDMNMAIEIEPHGADSYYNRAFFYSKLDDKFAVCRDAQKACELGICTLLENARASGYCR